MQALRGTLSANITPPLKHYQTKKNNPYKKQGYIPQMKSPNYTPG